MRRHGKWHRTFRAAGAPALLVAFSVAGCTDDFTGLNTNPNAPTDVGVRYLLPAGLTSTVRELLGTDYDRGTASTWVQHYARLQYTTTDRYFIEPTFSDGLWGDLYTGGLIDFDGIVTLAEATGATNQHAVGLILRAWVFHNMTDLWGDIPFREALRGTKDGGTTTPAYDAASDVYHGVLADLAEASAAIDPAGSLFGDLFRGTAGNPDLLYGGDLEKWRRFANSLRLRVAMRLTEFDPEMAAQEASAAVAAGVFAGAGDEAVFRWPGLPPNENPMAPAFTARPGDFRISNSIVDTLRSLNDPRLSIYADPNQDDEYVGMPNGLVDEHGISFEAVSRVGSWFLRPETPTWILSYAEVALLMAEAAQRGFVAGDPAALYRDGIEASMRMFEIPQAEIDAYLAQPAVRYDPARGLEQIAVQMWLALYDQGPEAYSYWRRTGIPVLTPARDNLNDDRIPVRLPYPVSEQSVNGANLSEAVARQGLGGGDAQWNTPLFWQMN